MRILFIIIVMCAFAFELSIAQIKDSTALFRSKRPVAGKIGLEGLGIDITIGSTVAIEATSFFVYNTAKARILLLKNNSTPFLGIGVGSASSFGGDGDRSWTVLLLGWEHDYKRLYFDFIIEATIQKSHSYDRSVFPFSFEIGWRF
jgi:hypothetical protein